VPHHAAGCRGRAERSPVHVEHLGSIENVAKAKAELVEGMKTAELPFLNADDPRLPQWSH